MTTACDEDEGDWPYEPHLPTVWDDDPNPEVGRLYGPDGALLSIVRARDPLAFGFTGSA